MWKCCFVCLFVLFLGENQLFADDPPNKSEKRQAEEADEKEIPIPPPVVPPTREALEAAIQKGITFLLEKQNKDGSWGSARQTKGLNIYAPVPGAHHAFRTAVTALCISALIESGNSDPTVAQAIDRGEAWLIEHLPILRRATPDAIYNIWGHGYAIQGLVRLRERKPDDARRRETIDRLIREQYELLRRYESVDGGWGYYDFRAGAQRPTSDSTSFTTATVLVAFHEGSQQGIVPPSDVVQRAVKSIERQKKPDFSYLYGEYLKWSPMMGINRPAGSLGRSQACNLALRLNGDKSISDQVLIDWLNRLFARNGWLDIGRKRPIPHEAHFQIAGYFYYYGHYYAARCIEQLPAEQRKPFQDQLAVRIMSLQEKDGSWWDFPFYDYHQQYGTAFGVMCLLRCRGEK